MPALAAIPAAAWLTAGTAVATAGGMAYAANKQSQSARRASELEQHGADEALQFERDQAAELKRQWESTEAQRRKEWQATEDARRSQWEAEEADAAPYRQMRQQLLGNYAALLGINVPQGVASRWDPKPYQPGTYGQPTPQTAASQAGAVREPSSMASLADPRPPRSSTMPLTPPVEPIPVDYLRRNMASLAQARRN